MIGIGFSGNITSAEYVFQNGTAGVPGSSPGDPGFETESCCDELDISFLRLYGNLDNSHTVEYTTPAAGFNFSQYQNDNYHNMEWISDYSVNMEGWKTKGVKVYCGRTNQPAGTASNVSRLHSNGQRDGVLLGGGDIRYFSTIVEPDAPLLIHLKQDAPPTAGQHHADYDLYASWGSTTTTPGPGVAGVDYNWASTRGIDTSTGNMQEDTILIPPYGDGLAHYVYFSVYAYAETPTQPGGYRVYDNTVTERFNWRVATDFEYRSGGPYGDQTSALMADLYSISGGVYQVTDGTAYIQHFDIWDNDNTCGGRHCDLVFSSPGGQTFCGGSYGCNAIGSTTQIVDRSWDTHPVMGRRHRLARNGALHVRFHR